MYMCVGLLGVSVGVDAWVFECGNVW